MPRVEWLALRKSVVSSWRVLGVRVGGVGLSKVFWEEVWIRVQQLPALVGSEALRSLLMSWLRWRLCISV